MALYTCELVDAEGRLVEATREASSEAEVVSLFSRGDKYLLSIERRSPRSSRRRAIGAEELREIAIALGALLESGLELEEGLAIAAETARKGSGARRLLAELHESVEKGSSLSDALEACGGGFSKFYVGMVRIGEVIGSVERVLPRLATYLTERKILRERIAGALVYPAIVCAVAVLGAIGILVFLLPRLLDVLGQLGGAAAEEARRGALAMENASYCVVGVLLFLVSASLAIARLRRRDEELASRLDALALRLPAAGGFLAAYETLGFACAMETLVGGGLSIEDGFGEAAEVVENRAFRGAIVRCREAALKGESLSLAAGKCPELPPRLAQWLAIGERSGRLAPVFEQLRHYYQGEVDRMSSRFMTLIEPALIVLVGGLVLIMALAFVVPLFSMYGAML